MLTVNDEEDAQRKGRAPKRPPIPSKNNQQEKPFICERKVT
jgi:hypothetical protein